MAEFSEAIITAILLIFELDAELTEIVALSLRISLSAVLFAGIIGMPIGALLAIFKFRGKFFIVVIMNAMMGMPPVVVGLIVYLLLSRSGPFGVFGLLFTPTAMIIAQVLLVTPIISALTRQIVEDLWIEYEEQLRSLGATHISAIPALLWDGRFTLITAILAGFGRAAAEVGGVMIVGGNIDHVTRVMTTSIALEVSKGNLSLALGLGIILLLLSASVNGAAYIIQNSTRRWHS
ncbi:MAG: ABC transporter permease [Pseudomonadota bacterium]|nr:ABC transporter permease [Pseudomonadota bacterium]